MSSLSESLPKSAPPNAGAPGRLRVTPHHVVGVAWLSYWLTNVYVLFGDIAPFLTYYVMVALFLIYYALARPVQVVNFLATPLIWLWAMTALIPAMLYFSDRGAGIHAYDEMKMRIVYFSALASMALVVSDQDGLAVLRMAARISLGIVIVMCLGELFIHNPYATAPGRSAGFYGDANAAAAALAILLVLSVDITKQTLMGLTVVGLTLIAILTTLSRAGILLGSILAAAYLFVPTGPGTLAAGSRMAIALAGVGSGMFVVVAAVQLFNLDTTEAWRIGSVFQLDTSDKSAQSRIDRVYFTARKFLEYFWTGRGPGSTNFYGVSAHNTYLTIGYEYGVFGLLIYLGFIVHGFFITWWYGWRRAASFAVLATALAFLGLFSHTVHARPTVAIIFVVFMTQVLIETTPAAKESPDGSQARSFGSGPTSPYLS